MEQFELISYHTYDDGNIDFSVRDNKDLSAHVLLEALETDQGYEIFKFNREIGTMDHYFTLTMQKGDPKTLIQRIFQNCVFYLKGGHTPGLVNIKIDMGDRVICDHCNEEYTNSDLSGGFLFDGKGICPKCAPDYLKSVESFNELEHIRAYCPSGLSFAQFIIAIRK